MAFGRLILLTEIIIIIIVFVFPSYYTVVATAHRLTAGRRCSELPPELLGIEQRTPRVITVFITACN